MDFLTSDLWTALILRQYDSANRLIYCGANVNEPRNTQFGVMTLLHYAAATGDIQCMDLLIKHGANLHARDFMGRTPLHWAVKTGDRPDAVEVLINEGAVVDAWDVDESTPLHRAVKNNFNVSAQKLIDRGASMEAVNMWGYTVLHSAALYNNLSMVKVLISHGVNLEAKDSAGRTPLIYALDNADITQLLLDNGADVNTQYCPLLFAVHNFPLATFTLLLKSGACVNATYKSTGLTALHVVGEKPEHSQMAALLLKFGADLNLNSFYEGRPFDLLQLNPNSPSIEATATVFIREAVKREALGKPICGYKEIAQSRENYSQFDRECREELMRMRTEKIDIEGNAMSFFYIFSMDEEKLTELAKNKKIVTAFETSDYLASFRIYAGELTRKFEVAKKRANFLTSVEDCLIDVLGDILPAPIVRKIVTYAN